MNKTFKLLALSLGGALASYMPLAHAVEPTSGAYVTDPQNTWVQDRVGDRISTVNMIMCVMSALRSDAMVNQGAYLALIDEGKCSERGDSGKSTSTNAGESNATNYMSAVVLSTQASTTDPLVMKAWISEEEEGNKIMIYVHGVATAGKSETYPNGLFTINFCSKLVVGGIASSTCMNRGMLKSDANGISFYEAESGGGGGGGGPSEIKLKLVTSSTDSGQGRVVGSDGGSGYDYTFSYDGNNFRRSDGALDTCFSREKDNANYSTWRYGTYQADGSRLDSTNPGFPVKYTVGSTTYFGFWSFWGLWLPDSAMATLGTSGTLTRRVGDADVALTVVKKGGKLWKLVRQASTLSNFKNASMMFWSQQSIGSLQQGTNYELQWDGTKLQAIGTQQCGPSGCSPQALSPAIDLNASDFRTAGVRMLPVFFPSGGSNGAIFVPTSGEFATETELAYRTRTMVAPNASDAPASLVCLSNCPKSGAALAAAFTSEPAQPFATSSWSPVAIASAAAYTFSAGMLSDGGGDVDGSNLSKSDMGSYQGGLSSGGLIAPADLDSVRCNVNGSDNSAGAYYCPGLVNKADVSYQWETGPNQWNQYFGAVGVTIDPPMQLSFTVTNDNIRAEDKSKFVGTTLQMQLNGFGELHGIPGHCVDPDTNAVVRCDQNLRWVPAFDIVDGAALTSGSNTYYVKYLQRELRLSKLAGASETTCKAALSLPTSLTLPDSTALTLDAATENGAQPTLSSSKPAVIDGTVQTESEVAAQ